MSSGKRKCSALVVVQSETAYNTLSGVLKGIFAPIYRAVTMVQARQRLSEGGADVLIINTPAADEMGVDSAIDLSVRRPVGILLIVKAELYEQVTYKTRGTGIFVLTRPLHSQMLQESAVLLRNMTERLMNLAEENLRLKRRLDEMGTISRAKCLLIEYRKMSEEQAHHYLEREAMDLAVSKKEAAQTVIRELTGE